jgi:hypothetical protein
MSLAAAAGKIGDHFARSLEHAVRCADPFEHRRIEDALPPATLKALAALPAAPGLLFFSPENRARFPVVDDVASAFQCRATVREIEELCGIALRGALLRVGCGRGAETGAGLFAMTVRLSEDDAGSGIIVVAGAGRGAKPLPLGHDERALVIAYVPPDWRAREELSYPDRPVG